PVQSGKVLAWIGADGLRLSNPDGWRHGRDEGESTLAVRLLSDAHARRTVSQPGRFECNHEARPGSRWRLGEGALVPIVLFGQLPWQQGGRSLHLLLTTCAVWYRGSVRDHFGPDIGPICKTHRSIDGRSEVKQSASY